MRSMSLTDQIIHLGAEHAVTGSCHLVQIRGVSIMVDCGIAQGGDPVVPFKDWPVEPSALDYLFLTHSHIDHIGRLPGLIQKGFRGEIITSHPTKALLGPMLRDAMGFSCMTGHEIMKLEQTIDDLSWGFEYNEKFDLKKGIRFTLGRAGHILGSCFVRFECRDSYWSVIFSGDLGAKGTPILPDPDIPEPADLLVLESTYGDRLHENREQRTEMLGKILGRALSDRGKVYIPAFALGRTQEVIYDMDRLFSGAIYQKRFPAFSAESRPPVFVDSPLGLEITKIYSGLSGYWDNEARELCMHGDHPIDFERLYAVKDYKDHLRLLDLKSPAVIIAGSGMCIGGRIVDHLKTGLEEKRNDVVFVGYQARGSTGRDIIRYSKKHGGYVYLDGKRVFIKAKVHILTGYSAHADQKGLVEWVESIPEKPKQIKLVHGEYQAQSALATVLANREYRVAE
jgi:metallo-beta-lactamase family protein